MQTRKFIQGTTPLLISIPHTGTFVPPELAARMTPAALRLPDTDWHLERVYDFAAGMGAGLLMATHSRYVIDLNRSAMDETLYPGQVKTGLCPLETFDGEKIYLEGAEPDEVEKAERVTSFWQPYHQTLIVELERLRRRFGYAILYDAHSIRSRVPRLFEGVLPDLNLGTVQGKSCAPELAEGVFKAAASGVLTAVLNGRFVGGHITRCYGRPAENIHALQMEMTWQNYMEEEYPFSYCSEKAERLQMALRRVITALLEWHGNE